MFEPICHNPNMIQDLVKPKLLISAARQILQPLVKRKKWTSLDPVGRSSLASGHQLEEPMGHGKPMENLWESG